MHAEVPLLTFSEAPTVASLALHIEAAHQADPGILAPPLVPIPRQGPPPMSVAQEQLWQLNQALPDTALFNILYAMRLTGRSTWQLWSRAAMRFSDGMKSCAPLFPLSMGNCAAHRSSPKVDPDGPGPACLVRDRA